MKQELEQNWIETGNRIRIKLNIKNIKKPIRQDIIEKDLMRQTKYPLRSGVAAFQHLLVPIRHPPIHPWSLWPRAKPMDQLSSQKLICTIRS